MEEHSKIWHLEKFNIIKSLTESEQNGVVLLSTMKSYCKKEIIYLPENACDKIFFLKKGKVKISRYSKDGKEMILFLLSPGELFGELSFSKQNNRNEVAEVIKDALMCSIKVEDLKKIIAENPNFSLQVVKVMEERVQKIENRLESLFFKTVTERIKEFILQLALETGKEINREDYKEIEVDLFLTHEEIAKLTATNRQSVTTVFNQLETQNIISYSRKKLLIKDFNALKS